MIDTKDILALAKRLRENSQGLDICPQCGNERNKPWQNECVCEGQCDWNTHRGINGSNFDDPFQAKEDMLAASKILAQY